MQQALFPVLAEVSRVKKTEQRLRALLRYLPKALPSKETVGIVLQPEVPMAKLERRAPKSDDWRRGVYRSGDGEKDKRRKPRKQKQREILRRQNNRCIYCGVSFTEEEIVWDHFEPYSLAGNRVEFVAACRLCNGIKAATWFPTVEAARKHIVERLNQREMLQERRLGNSSKGRLFSRGQSK